MASRRKSAKPTNKLRHVHIDDDDEEDDGEEDEREDDTLQNNDEEDSDGRADVMSVTFASLTTPTSENTFDPAIKNFKVSRSTMPTLQTVAHAPHQIQTGKAQLLLHHHHPQPQPQPQTQPVHSTLLLPQVNDDQAVSSSQAIEEPLLALPSDVYNDFEALRSATKLDSPALMRKLLKYYSKLTSSTVDRERKLDNVIEGIRGRSSSTTAYRNSSTSGIIINSSTTTTNNNNSNSTTNTTTITTTTTTTNNNNNNNNAAVVLDLSVQKKSHSQVSSPHPSDDFLRDEILNLTGSGNSPRPLDLTLQKEINIPTPPQTNGLTECPLSQRGAASSLFSTCFQTPASNSSCVYSSTDINQAAPYVINLEPLTSTIQLSTPIHKTGNTLERSGIYLPPPYDSKLPVPAVERTLKEGTCLQNHEQKSLVSNTLTGSQSTKPSLLSITTQLPKSDPTPSSYPPSALFPMHNAPLPSYKEAVGSSLFSKHTNNDVSNDPCGASSNSLVSIDGKTNKTSAVTKTNIDLTNQLLNLNQDGRHISVLQLSPDFHSIKNVQPQSSNAPENFLLEPISKKVSSLQEIISTPNFLLTQSVPTLSTRISSSSSYNPHHENSKFDERANSQFLNQNSQRNQMLSINTIASRSPLPPPPIVSNTAIHTILSTATPSSHSVYPQTSMPLQSLLMSQAPDGTVSNVVAIPVLPGLPEGYTTLQHFTFEPAVPLPAKSEIQSAPMTTSTLPLQPILFSAPIATTCNNAFAPTESPITSPHVSTATMLTNESQRQSILTSSEAKKEWVKLKPGRPKGRTGKANPSKKIQNKGMKLLTENSLFPGVYTSILKLPWSKRTRNKSKSKPGDNVKMSQEGQLEASSIDNADVESGERIFTAGDGYVPPELSAIVQQKTNEVRNENTLQTQQHHTSLDQPEQRQLFPHQTPTHFKDLYHKSTHELEESMCIDQSPCTSPLPLSNGDSSFAENLSLGTINIKKEIYEPSEMLCSEIRHNVMLSSASIAVGEPSNIPNSQDPIMLIYPNIGPNGSKSKKRRGRPPKKPMMEPKVHQDSFLFPVDSLYHSPDSITDASFLHGNNSNLSLMPGGSTPLNQEFTLMSPTSLPCSLSSKEKTAIDVNTVMAAPNSDFHSTQREHDETSLENRIIYLTNQIEMEMARGVNNRQPKENTTVNSFSKKQNEQLATHPEQTISISSAPVDTSQGKQVQEVKRRRKKTSRMLKSNENFVYATFRFKPRGGASAKKAKRKRKPNTTSMAANAETIANLRSKKLKCLDTAGPKSESDSARNDSSIQSWKFHEQYRSDSRQAKSPVPILSITSCATCGVPVRKMNDAPDNLHFCLSCSRNGVSLSKEDSADIDSHGDDNDEDCDSHVGEEEDEEIGNACISCGKEFEGCSESHSRCTKCRRNTQSFIGSSKLFSIPESSHQNTFSIVSNSIASTSHSDLTSQSSETLSPLDPFTQLTTSGILYCSLCRTQFTKINEYLLHIKQAHETTQTSKTTLALQKSDDTIDHSQSPTDYAPRRTKSILKTKKSLAHKTITCPVEDCPLFFRHQRDMDHHLKKVHLSTSLPSGMPTQQKDIPSLQNSGSTLKEMSTSLCPSSEDPLSIVGAFSHPLLNDNSVPVTLEESEDGRSTPSQSLEKPLRCDFCTFRCRQKNAMTWHMRKHPEAASQHRCYSNTNPD